MKDNPQCKLWIVFVLKTYFKIQKDNKVFQNLKNSDKKINKKYKKWPKRLKKLLKIDIIDSVHTFTLMVF